MRVADPDDLDVARDQFEQRLRDDLARAATAPEQASTVEMDPVGALVRIEELQEQRARRRQGERLDILAHAAGWITFGIVTITFVAAVAVVIASRGTNRAADAVATTTLGALVWILRRVIRRATGGSVEAPSPRRPRG